MREVQIGDKIRGIGGSAGIEGIVTSITVGYNTFNHGSIYFIVTKITNSKRYNWFDVGEEESTVHFDWEKNYEIVEEVG